MLILPSSADMPKCFRCEVLQAAFDKLGPQVSVEAEGIEPTKNVDVSENGESDNRKW